jgi:cobalt-zinc-cadmium efflux system outer membrane protein
MPMFARTLVINAVAVLLCAPAQAQDRAFSAQLSLSEAIRITVERNPALAAERNAVEIAEANRLDANLRPNPALTFESANYPLLESRRPPFFNNQELTLRFDQEVELAGRRRLRTQASGIAVEIAQARLRNAQRLLTFQVQRAYFQAVLAKADREVANTSLAEIDRALTLNRARFEKGETSGGEVRRLQVERLRFVDDVFSADLAFRNARSALLAFLNIDDLGQTVDVTEPLILPAGAAIQSASLSVQPGTSSPLVAQALVQRPDVAAIQGELARTATETRLQRALRTPNITVGGGYKRDFGTNAVVFGATLPLPLFNRNQGGVARAEAERRQAANLEAAAEVEVRLEVQQALNAVAVNRERVDYIQREHLSNARESRDIVEASYRLGAADLIDFLDAQRAFRDTQRTYNRALYEQHISMFELAAAAALPPSQP